MSSVYVHFLYSFVNMEPNQLFEIQKIKPQLAYATLVKFRVTT